MKKPDCKNHSLTIKGYATDFRQLANDIGDLRYDKLQVFLKELNEKLLNDSNSDWKGGRRELSHELNSASESIAKAVVSTGNAWRICKPYMGFKRV